jgi:formate dehydrogenase alpha subunit
MSGKIRLKIDDREIEVEKGTLLIEAAKRAGIDVPHFCYHPKLKPDANCRMCLVEVEKMPKLQTSCSTPVAEGMIVRTGSPKVMEAREGVMEFILANHPLDCPICDQGGECHLQDLGNEYSPTEARFTETKRVFEKEYFGPMIEKEMNRCISCLRCVRYCDEVLDVNALGSINRGTMSEIGGFAHHELDCEFCGGCIQICPVGALTSRVSMYNYRPWQVKKTETICGYCGDGCQLTLETIRQEVIRVSSEVGEGRNDGDLCARGYFGYQFINHKDRLARPIIRQRDRWMEVTWEIALDFAAKRLQEIKQTHGPGAIAGLISARCTNEEVYLFQKLMRLVIGTPHIDSSARYGQINAISAMQRVFGTVRLTSYEEIGGADVLLNFAGEMTETNPIVGLWVKEAVKKRGATLISIDPYTGQTDPYRSHLPRLAQIHLQVRPGSEGTAILAMAKALAVRGGSPLAEQIGRSLASLSESSVESATGVRFASFASAAERYAQASRGVALAGRSLTRSVDGYAKAMNLIDLGLLAGQPRLLFLSEENNEVGAVEMGAAPEFLPGLLPAADPASRDRYAKSWKGEIGAENGYTLVEMIEAAARGEIKALYLVGENPLGSLPSTLSGKAAEAFSRLDLLICQDLFMNESGGAANVVLPAASYAEKSGTFTNHEGQVQKVRAAIEPIQLSKPDWEIFSRLSGKLGLPLDYASSEEITREIALQVPLDLACPAAPETVRPSVERYLSGGFTSDLASRYDPSKIARPPSNGSTDLLIQQWLFHSGRLSQKAQGLLTLAPEAALTMNREDAERLGVANGEKVAVRVEGNEGEEILLSVKVSPKAARGTVLFPEHFADPPLRKKMPLTIDRVTKAPSFDLARVKISKAEQS